MSNREPSDYLGTPTDARLTRGLGSILPAVILLLLSLVPSGIAYAAARQPGCPWILNASLALACGLLGVTLCWVSVRSLIKSRIARIAACAVLSMLLVVFYAGGLSSMARMRGGSDVVRIGASLRGFAQARLSAIEEGIDEPSTLLVLMHDRIITPEIFFDMTCPTLPPMPRVDVFNYDGITAEDAANQRVTREALIEAANRSLADQPWERIGWFNFLREWPTPVDQGRMPTWIIVACAVYQRNGARIAIVTYSDSNTTYWHEPIEEHDRQELVRAISDAEFLGIAPPPQELIDFVKTPSETRR